MSDLRERLMGVGADALHPGPWVCLDQPGAHTNKEIAHAVIDAILPIIEAELQKRDEETDAAQRVIAALTLREGGEITLTLKELTALSFDGFQTERAEDSITIRVKP